MEGPTLIIFIVCGALTIWGIVDFFRGRSFGESMWVIKEALLAPFYYFFGATCDICGRQYFNSHKAFICCPGPHNAKWRREHPNEKCLADIRAASHKKSYYKKPPIYPSPQMHDCPRCKGKPGNYLCPICEGMGKTFLP